MNTSYYKGFTTEALAADPTFRAWCLGQGEQEAFWNSFLHQNPDMTAAVAEARRLVMGVSEYFVDQEVNPQTIRKRYRQTLNVARREARESRLRKRRYLIGIAACIALFLIFRGVKEYGNFSGGDAVERLVYKTDFGEQKSVSLPDGSTVRLNADSRLTLSEDWTLQKDREVWLEGEAYFSVTKQLTSKAKFTVHVREVSVEVLGTRFNVNARAQATEVALDEGKIRLYSSADTTEIMMVPGEVVRINKAAPEFTKLETADAQAYSSWKEGNFIYKNAPLATVLDDVRRTFGYTVEVKDPRVLTESITGALSVDDPDELLLILRDIMPRVSFEREGKKLTVDMK